EQRIGGDLRAVGRLGAGVLAVEQVVGPGAAGGVAAGAELVDEVVREGDVVRGRGAGGDGRVVVRALIDGVVVDLRGSARGDAGQFRPDGRLDAVVLADVVAHDRRGGPEGRLAAELQLPARVVVRVVVLHDDAGVVVVDVEGGAVLGDLPVAS